MTYDLARVRHVVLDMDGTIYLGKKLFPHTLPLLTTLTRLEIGYSFVTNNCSHSRAEYVRQLNELGIHASADSIWTSAHATIHHLTAELPRVKRLFVLGTAGLVDEFRQAGFEIVDGDPDAVVVGFDTALTYDVLARTAWWISRGLPYIATHPDRVCPTDRPIVLPDCGAICSLLETATGRRPDMVPGKPNPAMIEAVFARHGFAPHEVALVGDRLYTDMRMARDAGAIAVLTLTGETTLADIDTCPESNRPDLVVANLGKFGCLLEAAR